MKILITGINGFIGERLAACLGNGANEIHGLDIHDQANIDVDRYFQIDIRKEFHLSERYDFIIHLAGLSRTNVDVDYDYETIKKINVDGVTNTIASCWFTTFVFLSTALVYARDETEIDERSAIRLDSLYSRTKFEAENVLRKQLKRHQYLILRPVNVVGVQQKKVAFMPIFFDLAVKNKDIPLFAPSNKTMQLLDVDELCKVIRLVLLHRLCGTYNVAPDECIEMNALIDKIIQITGSQSNIIYYNDNLEAKSFIKAASLQREIGWCNQKSIDRILTEFYDVKYKKCIYEEVNYD